MAVAPKTANESSSGRDIAETTHLDLDDPRYPEAAAAILRRHDLYEAEANITSAVRDFLLETGLVASDDIHEEVQPAEGARESVDLTVLSTFIEIKRRIGTGSGAEPDPQNIRQLDDYLAQAETDGHVFRMGVLTDGRHWLLRWPGAGPVRTAPPHAFTLDNPGQWFLLYQWLRDHALFSETRIQPERENVARSFGPDSPLYEREKVAFTRLYAAGADSETVRIKRRLWGDLLRAALGEVAKRPDEMDDLFIRHTYLSAVIGLAVQASFGVDIAQLAQDDPADLLLGQRFQDHTGLQGIVESDFFTWPLEVGGQPALRALAQRVAHFDWPNAPADIAAILYETVIPPAERRQLGEYYTPHWLAKTMVEEVVTDSLGQHVLDPACGSGTFIAEAVTHLIAAAEQAGLEPRATLDRLRASVTGMDVHPVAVHLARAAWALAARPAIQAAGESGSTTTVSVPVYLGDALQMRFRNGDMFSEHEVTLPVEDEWNSELVFPVQLVQRADAFDLLMSDIAAYIEQGADPVLALDDHGIADAGERRAMEATIAVMRNLHAEGRNHIWAYYTRNLVRPVALALSKVDVIIGNPPWLNYNKTANTLRQALEEQSKNLYGIWAGGRYATHQDVAGLFFARCVDLYLKDGGVIGMVMPHSALQTGQYSKWRSGRWMSEVSGLVVDFSWKSAWDLERLEPNTFFPIPASVVFARRVDGAGTSVALEGAVERWVGEAGASNVQRVRVPITDTSVGGESPYARVSRQGAIIVPRRLFLVEETENPTIVQAGQTVTVNPRRSSQDKEPWRSVDLTKITEQTIENEHVFDVYLGETVAPYVTLDPLKAVLPLKRTDWSIARDEKGEGGIRMASLQRRMRRRWSAVTQLWDANKSRVTELDLLGQLDYYGKLSAQLAWRQDPGGRPIRILYTRSGAPTAALLTDDYAIVDNLLFWVTCKSHREAHFLLAVINSECLADAVNKYTTPNWAGKTRDLHKHLWKLPIPEFDPNDALHVAIADAGQAAESQAMQELTRLREARGQAGVTWRIARRELRKWLHESPEGQAVDYTVKRLLA